MCYFKNSFYFIFISQVSLSSSKMAKHFCFYHSRPLSPCSMNTRKIKSFSFLVRLVNVYRIQIQGDNNCPKGGEREKGKLALKTRTHTFKQIKGGKKRKEILTIQNGQL